MKLAVSNIAWEKDELDSHLQLIKRLGCHGVEIAPSLIWPEPVEIVAKERTRFKDRVNSHGLEIVGLHALLFTHPELELLGSQESREGMEEYLKGLFEVCRDVGGKTLIFGSPKNRHRRGKDNEECLRIAADFFAKLAASAKKYEVTLCIEPLSHLESDFITTSEEGAALVNAVGHPNFGLHLDAKAMFEARENFQDVFAKHGKLLRHFHVGDSGLTPPGTAGFDHKIAGRALSGSGYKKFVSIEMRRGSGPSLETIEKSINYVKSCYTID